MLLTSTVIIIKFEYIEKSFNNFNKIAKKKKNSINVKIIVALSQILLDFVNKPIICSYYL